MGRKSRFSKEQWSCFIAEQVASGLSAAKFCKQKNLRLPTFYQQRRTLSSKARERTDCRTLVPLQVVAGGSRGCGIGVRRDDQVADEQRICEPRDTEDAA